MEMLIPSGSLFPEPACAARPGERVGLGGVACVALDGGRLRLDVPLGKTLRLELAIRPLLVKRPGLVALVDCGPGQVEPELAVRFGVEPPALPLLEQLARLGLRPGDIDLLALTHLHFDHAGGALLGGRPAFPRADLVVQQAEWRAGLERRRGGVAGRLEEAWPPCRLRLLCGDGPIAPGLEAWLTPGHTPGLMTIRIVGEDGEALFPSDLLPMARSLGLTIDRYSDADPELALAHRRRVVDHLVRRAAIVFYAHDPRRAVSLAVPGARGGGARPACLAR